MLRNCFCTATMARNQLQRLILQGAPAVFQQSAYGSNRFGVRALSTGFSSSDQTNGRGSWGKALLGLAGLGAVGAVGAASVSEAHADAAKLVVKVPTNPYERPTTLNGLPAEITIYQYDVCPFCCKVKAFLDYHKMPYKVVEVNPLTKGELSWSTYRKVPVCDFDGGLEIVVDSSFILSRLDAEIARANSKKEGVKKVEKTMTDEEELEWRKWVDDRFVKIITANIYRSWDETWASFTYITEQTNWAWGTREAARITGAVLMWQIGKKLPAKYGIEGDLREQLYNDCNKIVDALKGNPFLGGSEPNLVDISAFGVMRAVASTPTFKDALEHSRIKEWYSRMEAAVGPSQCTNPKVSA